MIRYWLLTMKIGQAATMARGRSLAKQGTPTMGGALVLTSIAVSTVLWADLSNRFVWVVLFVMLGFGAIGWVDDYRKVVHKTRRGMSAKEKLFLAGPDWPDRFDLSCFAVSAPSTSKIFNLIFLWVQSGFTNDLPSKADLIVPFFKNVAYPLGLFGFITPDLVCDRRHQQRGQFDRRARRACHHAGRDGGSALAVFAYVVGRRLLPLPALPLYPGRCRADGLCGAMAGAGLGFLWFQRPPGQGVHDDVGALSLGASLAPSR